MDELKHINPEEVSGIEKCYATLAVTGEVAHKLMNWTAHHSNGLDRLGGKDWELFNVSHRGAHQGRDYVWGMFLEGIGAFNVMVPLENTRKLSEAEREIWEGRPMAMVGSHTGKVSYGFSASLGPNLPTKGTETA